MFLDLNITSGLVLHSPSCVAFDSSEHQKSLKNLVKVYFQTHSGVIIKHLYHVLLHILLIVPQNSAWKCIFLGCLISSFCKWRIYSRNVHELLLHCASAESLCKYTLQHSEFTTVQKRLENDIIAGCTILPLALTMVVQGIIWSSKSVSVWGKCRIHFPPIKQHSVWITKMGWNEC